MKKVSGTMADRKVVEKYLLRDGNAVPVNASHLIVLLEEEGKLTAPDYKLVDPDLTPANLSVKMGFTADFHIADLVVSLNKIGVITIDSCEGHKDRHFPFSNVGFWGYDLYKVMSIVQDWGSKGKDDDVVVIAGEGPDDSYHTFFVLGFVAESLKKSRQMAQDLSKFIDNKSL